MATIILLLFILTVFWGVEYYLHMKKLRSIPVRIHVNGTRGKSSVTRLIAAGLRENGKKVFAKTTGTLPKMILDDGSEYPIYRPSKANIIEQLRIVSFAALNKAEILVIECMALQPKLQSMSELKMVRATHGVITNARADHLDVMGPAEENVAEALIGTTPINGKFFTAEQDYLELFEKAAKDRGSEFIPITDQDRDEVKDEELTPFSYFEHRENVALALKVCQSLGCDRELALKGMWSATPDSGAMTESVVNFFGRELLFVNGFAANDPESTEKIWNITLQKYSKYSKKIIVINCRADRADRTKQIAEAIVNWERADHYVVIGTGTYIFIKYGVKNGLSPKEFINCENMDSSQIFEAIVQLVKKDCLIMGLANIAGPGLELVKYFNNRSVID